MPFLMHKGWMAYGALRAMRKGIGALPIATKVAVTNVSLLAELRQGAAIQIIYSNRSICNLLQVKHHLAGV